MCVSAVRNIKLSLRRDVCSAAWVQREDIQLSPLVSFQDVPQLSETNNIYFLKTKMWMCKKKVSLFEHICPDHYVQKQPDWAVSIGYFSFDLVDKNCSGQLVMILAPFLYHLPGCP